VSLADVEARIARLQERLAGRVARPEPPPPRKARRVFRCGRCRERGHTWGRCPLRDMLVWTSGTELWIASSVADAAALEREADATFSDGDAVPTPTEAWKVARRAGELLTLQTSEGRREQWTELAWIRANGRSLLSLDGRTLAPGRRVPA